MFGSTNTNETIPTVLTATETVESLTAQLAESVRQFDAMKSNYDVLSASVVRGQSENRAALIAARELHESDIATIGETLLSEAESRNWCSEYDEVVSGLNRQLNVSLPLRTRSYSVTAMIEVRVTVEATDTDDADDKAREYFRDAENAAGNADGIDFADLSSSYNWTTEVCED